MFDNIGTKIKTLAKVICWIGIALSIIFAVGSVILAFVVGASSSASNAIVVAATGVACGLLGILFSWIGSFFAYGFGEIVENTAEIARNTRH